MTNDTDGQMVRRGIILTGYHNSSFEGRVLSLDGEVLGTWMSDEEEWCHFIPDGMSKVAHSAPSPWMLHDVIADKYSSKKGGDE